MQHNILLIADHLTVSRIKTAETSGSKQYDKQLLSYSSVPRSLIGHQVLAVPLHPNSSAAGHWWVYDNDMM